MVDYKVATKMIYLCLLFTLFLQVCVCLGSQTLNYSLLNYDETITVALQNYFQYPSQVHIDQDNSTANIHDILTVKFTEQPLTKVSEMPLSVNSTDNITYDFNIFTVQMQRSVFNHPNKVFLMSENVIFSIRYQVSNSDNISFVQAFKITKDSSSCSHIEVQQFNSSYYLFIACLYNNGNATVYLYRFNQTKAAFLNNLVFIGRQDFKLAASCNRVMLYSFSQLFLQRLYNNRVLFFCANQGNPLLSSNRTFILNVINNKGVDSLTAQNYSDTTISNCIKSTTLILEYQKGFIALSEPNLHYYSYHPTSNLTYCTRSFLNVNGMKYLASVQDKGVQYIYVIFQRWIIVKQSYSPNYQNFSISSNLISGLTLVDYAIARRLLTLLYQNSTDYYLLIFDLHSSYPKLVDAIHYPRNYTFLHLYSVQNYLQMGNYFLVYNSVENLLTLKIYLGYQVAISINDSSLALGQVVLALTDSAFETLFLNMNIRDFYDLTLKKSGREGDILLVEDVLTMNLTDYVIGPLGRFYNYPNNLTAFQYINFQSELIVQKELDIMKENIVAVSINNELNKPIVTFYSNSSLILTCELDYSLESYQTRLSQCKPTKSHKNIVENPREIVVLTQQRYLQFDAHNIELCQLSDNGQFECSVLNILSFTDIVQVKVTEYSYSDTQQQMLLIIFAKKEIVYCQLERYYPSQTYSVSINYRIRQNNIPELASMSVIDLAFDQDYAHFLVLRLIGDTDFQQKLIVYDKPLILPNSSSNLIGHVIEAFERIELQAFFCINNLLVVITTELGGFTIREYKITKEYRLRYTRLYPLYDFKVKQGGRHTQNQNFIFLQIEEDNLPYYLVYSPLLPSANLLTHKIPLQDGAPLFFQQIDPISNSSLLLLASKKLVGVTLPNFVFKFLRPHLHSIVLSNFNISVVDNSGALSILNYKFSYNQNEGSITYLSDGDIDIHLDNSNREYEFFIQSQNLLGIVADYNLSVSDSPDCSSISIEKKDIFTKQQCLLYYVSHQYGTITDFVAITLLDSEIEIVVTDTSLFCVKNRRLPSLTYENFTNLTDCKFTTNENEVLMSCINSNSFSREIYLVNVSVGISVCYVQLQPVVIPQEFIYQDFNLLLADSYIIFEVPIRIEDNKIYYKTQFKEGIINNSYALLRKEEQKDVYQTQFASTDTALSNGLFLLLENGIGIYNISDSSLNLSPALWLSSKQLSHIKGTEPLAYIKIIELKSQAEFSVLLIELGTISRSLEIEVSFVMSPNSSATQTVYDLISVTQVFQYEQYINCKNTVNSESQRYENLIVKVCNYEPLLFSVFANFIAINNDSSNALIQFYNRSGDSSYSVRIDVIYSNTLSQHDFVIRGNTMVVGSLFNMLCYYELTPTLSWRIKHSSSQTDEMCQANLTIYNKQYAYNQAIKIYYDGDSQQPYWSIGSLYIQRAVLLAIVINTIRLVLSNRKIKKNKTKRKESNRMHFSRFEVMVKISSKKQI